LGGGDEGKLYRKRKTCVKIYRGIRTEDEGVKCESYQLDLPTIIEVSPPHEPISTENCKQKLVKSSLKSGRK